MNQLSDPSQTTSGLPFEAAEINDTTSDQLRSLYLLVTLFPVGSARAGSTVIGLDNEGVLLLLLAVYGTSGPQHPFTRCPVQHLSFKRGLLSMNLKCTDLSWKKQDNRRQNQWLRKHTNDFLFSACISTSYHCYNFHPAGRAPNPGAVIYRTRCAFRTESIHAARGRITVCFCNYLIAEQESHCARKHSAQVQCFECGSVCIDSLAVVLRWLVPLQKKLLQ